MDEATSSLDSESEALIQKALDTVLRGRTSFVVAHRLSTITSADMIVVMDKGAIIEKGRHEELMQIDGGQYRKLYEELRGTRSEEQV
jgi:ABC-type multidrug transport system fused ATPase/permease subunit